MEGIIKILIYHVGMIRMYKQALYSFVRGMLKVVSGMAWWHNSEERTMRIGNQQFANKNGMVN